MRPLWVSYTLPRDLISQRVGKVSDVPKRGMTHSSSSTPRLDDSLAPSMAGSAYRRKDVRAEKLAHWALSSFSHSSPGSVGGASLRHGQSGTGHSPRSTVTHLGADPLSAGARNFFVRLF